MGKYHGEYSSVAGCETFTVTIWCCGVIPNYEAKFGDKIIISIHTIQCRGKKTDRNNV